MYQTRRLFLGILLVTSFFQTDGASKYNSDENRPYEFGFNIEGEQHRHEKKDENGLIMGEFGFLTADGVYHVTVYATDENGNFKIISMKNIRVKPYPTTSIKQGHSLKFPPSDQEGPQQQHQQNPPPHQQPVQQPAQLTQPQTYVQPQINIASPIQSCSHCSIPTTSTIAPQLSDFAVVSEGPQPNFVDNNSNPQIYNPQNYQGNTPIQNNNYPDNAFNANSNLQQTPQVQDPNYYNNYQNNNNNKNPNENVYPPSVKIPDRELSVPRDPIVYEPQAVTSGERSPKQYDNNNDFNLQNPSNYPEEQQPIHPQDVSQHSRFSDNTQNQQKPVLISAQMQVVDKNTDVNHLAPGERPGLPNGLTKDDMSTLLYTFNYTVGFHGHHEEGYTNGAKKGYYFITGRNGIKTRVDYVADSTGFHPTISQEVLDVLSDEVPKPETERDEKYGLKGYEFKWLYYPSGSRR